MKHVAVSVVIALLAGAAAAQDGPGAPRKFPYFADSDTDRNGFLSRAEWDASGRSPRRFGLVDADRDGRVSHAELTAATAAARAAAAAEYQPKP